jgi:polysaccharide export outer membrane protein
LVHRLKAGLLSVSLAALAAGLAGCAELPSAGPSMRTVVDQGTSDPQSKPYELIDIDPSTIDILSHRPRTSFAARFGDHRASTEPLIGVGDLITVTIWEASSGGLFSSAAALEKMSAGANSATIPEQVVGRDGSITVPYAGRVHVAGSTPRAVQDAVVHALEGKAIQPQVLITDNKPISATITIGGEGIASAQRLPLSAKGDRLLDVIAEAGGVRMGMGVNDIVVVLQRGGVTERASLQRVTSDSRENIYMRPGDVVTLVKDPQTFFSYGATLTNGEIPFGTDQLSLAQALVKGGGLTSTRSDARGVFVFRLEQPSVLRELRPDSPLARQSGRVPVVYRLDLSNPNSMFMEQRFQVASHDLVYVSDAPTVALQKALQIFDGVTAPAEQVTYSAAISAK